jgi:hypothetical protein
MTAEMKGALADPNEAIRIAVGDPMPVLVQVRVESTGAAPLCSGFVCGKCADSPLRPRPVPRLPLSRSKTPATVSGLRACSSASRGGTCSSLAT